MIQSNETTNNKSNETTNNKSNETTNNTAQVTNVTSNDNTTNSTASLQPVNASTPITNNTLEAKNDTNPSKKSEVKTKSNELPPIYLTVKNGEKLLVVHPTAEFINSLPRINFTESDEVKRTVINDIRTVMSPLNAHEREEEEEEDGEYDDYDDDDDREEEKSNIVTRSNIFEKSDKRYVSVPVINPDPNSKIGHWLNTARDKVFGGESSPSQRSFDQNQNYASQAGNSYPSDVSQNIQNSQNAYEQSRKSFFKGQPEASLPVPKEIQNLYQQYAPGDGKNNFQYAPSNDEVREELNFVERNKNENPNEREDSSNGQMVPNTQETQLPAENDYNNRVIEPESAPINPSSQTQWDREGEQRLADGIKRNRLPIILTKEHVGFGPITVEAKTADAPPDDSALDE